MFKGIAVSNGIAIGPAYILDKSKLRIPKQRINKVLLDEEVDRFRKAIDKTKAQMQETKKKTSTLAKKYSIILDTYTLLLEDDILVNDTVKIIKKEQINAEWAITKTLNKFTQQFNNINDDYLKGKKDDLELVVHSVIKNLFGHNQDSISGIQEPAILITRTLSPSDTLAIPRNFILGLATEAGGKTSHVGIFTSALGIPSVVGIKNLTTMINTGDNIIIDGIAGCVITNPSENDYRQYKEKQANLIQYEKNLLENNNQPALTKDNVRIRLTANIESTHEIKALKKYGAEGVGLYRTEFLYLSEHNNPSEKFLYENFKQVVQEFCPLPVVIRTLDIGMDKKLHSSEGRHEDNPALGLRGIRMSLASPEQFTIQLRAILRASIYGEARILYPMITDTDEIIKANIILESVKQNFRSKKIPFKENIQVGAMIETPASAIRADLILNEVDFISIGTNDLIQYLLAVDRVNDRVAYLYQPFNPAVLKTLKHIFNAAEAAGKKVSICGQLGGDPMATLFLIGLGNLSDLSMDPHSIPKIKKIICQSTLSDAKKFTQDLLNLSSTDKINHFLSEQMKKRYPSDFPLEYN